MKLKFKQLFCFHKWVHLDKPNSEGKSNNKCNKCGKVSFEKLNSFKEVPRNYCWCPNCGNDLVRDSFESETEEGIVMYVCTGCGIRSRWHFGVAPCAILLEEESE